MLNKVGFKKNNNYGSISKRGKGKKTLVKEAINKLKKVGITPVHTSNEILTKLLSKEDLTPDQYIKILNITCGLWKYEILSRPEAIRMDQLEKDNEVLLQENKDLKDFIGTPDELLKELEKKIK